MEKCLSQATPPDRSVDPLRRTWYDPRAVVRDSPIHGKGMFASRPISCGEVVVRIGGQLMTGAEFQSYVATVSSYSAVQVGENAHIVEIHAAHGGMNHSCDSNLWMSDQVTMVARREIGQNEELTQDYALYTANPRWVLKPCRCRARVCRHEITGDDWRLLDIQERYKTHFSPFLNEWIRRLNEVSTF